MNDITHLDFLPLEVKTFIAHLQILTEHNGVDLRLSPEREVFFKIGGKGCNGFFEDNSTYPILAVATGQPLEQWFPILIHESSHMDQWMEQIPEWTGNVIGSMEMMEIVDLWCDDIVELSPEQLNRYISAGQRVELDCEIRTVEKIKQYNLQIDIDEYIQKANAYVWFYAMIKETRAWYEIGKEPYNDEQIWTMMPKVFLKASDYETLPPHIHDVFLRLF